MNHKTGAAPLCHRPSHEIQRRSIVVKKWNIRYLAGLIVLLLVGTCAGCTQEGTASKTVRTFEICYASFTLEELCERSPVIVRGTIEKIGKSTDVQDTVHTSFTINVTDLIKGGSKYATKATSWFEGGETKTQIASPVSGTFPQVGEEHIFFISTDGSYYPFYQIRDNTVGLPEFSESKLLNSSAAQQTVPADALVAEIKDIVAAQAAK